MKRACLRSLAAGAVVLLLDAPDSAHGHGDCTALREKLSGAACKHVAACYVREAKRGHPAAVCVAAQQERLVRRFAREAELRPDCPEHGDAADVIAILDSTSQGLAAALSLDGNRCATAKMGAAAKACTALLRDCHASAERKHVPVDPACVEAAALRMTAAFGKAEARFPCATAGDDAVAREAVETAVDDVIAELTIAP